MADDSIEFLDGLPKDIDGKLRQGHERYEANHGIVCDYKTFSMVLRDAGGETIGVLSAYTAFAEIYIDDIWVDANHRNRGLGRKLLEALEDRYKDAGYNNINLVTSQFQAVGFLPKMRLRHRIRPDQRTPPRIDQDILHQVLRWAAANPRHPGKAR